MPDVEVPTEVLSLMIFNRVMCGESREYKFTFGKKTFTMQIKYSESDSLHYFVMKNNQEVEMSHDSMLHATKCIKGVENDDDFFYDVSG